MISTVPVRLSNVIKTKKILVLSKIEFTIKIAMNVLTNAYSWLPFLVAPKSSSKHVCFPYNHCHSFSPCYVCTPELIENCCWGFNDFKLLIFFIIYYISRNFTFQ